MSSIDEDVLLLEAAVEERTEQKKNKRPTDSEGANNNHKTIQLVCWSGIESLENDSADGMTEQGVDDDE